MTAKRKTVKRVARKTTRKNPVSARKKAAVKKNPVRKKPSPKYCIAISNGKAQGFWTGKSTDARKGAFDDQISKAAKFSDTTSANTVKKLIKYVPRGWTLSVKKR